MTTGAVLTRDDINRGDFYRRTDTGEFVEISTNGRCKIVGRASGPLPRTICLSELVLAATSAEFSLALREFVTLVESEYNDDWVPSNLHNKAGVIDLLSEPGSATSFSSESYPQLVALFERFIVGVDDTELVALLRLRILGQQH